MPVPPQIQKALDDLDKQLHEPSPISNVLNTIEQKTGVKRLHLVIGIVALQAIYLVFGHFAELVCNTMGFIYPAYCSVLAVESHSKDDDTQWLTYWIVFAVLSIAEFFSQQILAVFPIYWLIKAVFLLWLYLPATLGATKIYERFIKPFVMKHHKTIDERFAEGAQKARDTIRDAVNQHLD